MTLLKMSSENIAPDLLKSLLNIKQQTESLKKTGMKVVS